MTFCPEGIIFDMDGVITDTMPYHFRAWKKALADYGIEVDSDDIYLREGQKGIETARELMKENGYKLSLDKAREILELKEKIFKQIAKPKLIKGSKELIKDIKRHNFKLALATGTARDEVKHILPFDIYQLFDVTITGNEVKLGKPSPEPYLRALNALGLKSAECVVLENSPFGIKSAKGANLYCVAIATYLPKEYLQEADMIVDSFKEIDNILCKLKKSV